MVKVEDSICLALIMLTALLAYYAGWFVHKKWMEKKGVFIASRDEIKLRKRKKK